MASANGLFENRSWQFQTSTDRANKAFVTDLIEKKKGGFFDSFAPPRVENTFFNMDCNLIAEASGTTASSQMEAATSSPTTAPGSDLVADATGNDALNATSGESGPLNSDQSNTGDQSASVSDNTATVGDIDASGGTTEQVLNNDQLNTGDQSASISDSSACTTVTGSASAN